jgi:hypothetical protein
MLTIKVRLSEVEEKAFRWAAADPQFWAENAIRQRVKIAMNEIYEMEIARMKADPNTTHIPVNVEQVVMEANIKSAAERMQELPLPPAPPGV